MGKRKAKYPNVEEILARPWCYYCERDFDDTKVLINHQKAKHFKCDKCGRRLSTAGGLSVHMTQVHKETLTSIENALPNRSNLDVEIFGMEGIPQDVANSHRQRVLSQFAQAEAERRAATGNPGSGVGGVPVAKKPKLESAEDLKKRLAEHKAKKAAEQAAGISSGDVTPVGAGQGSPSPAVGQSPAYVGLFSSININANTHKAGSPPYPQQVMPYGGAPNSTYSSFPQTYGPPSAPFQQPQFPQPGFGSPATPQFSGQQFPGQPGFPQQFSPPYNQNFAQPPFQNGPPRFGAGSPPLPYNQGPLQPPRTATPPQQRPGSLPPAPGLPQRPALGAPPVNAFQMQQLHQGQLPVPPHPMMHSNQQSNTPTLPDVVQKEHGKNGVNNTQEPHKEVAPPSFPPPTNTEIKSLGTEYPVAAKVETKTEEATDKKGKKEKEKDKGTKMIYSDNQISPEEKLAKLPRYAFIPDGKGETVLGGVGPAVTGAVTGSDDVMDRSG
ncbi:MAG: hypothetical protein MMC33_008177 [Icmadophila ericetorum]|nr:hypothetical protein [Icmadophila ericetorum]